MAVCYLLVNLSFFAALTYQQILSADAVALVSLIDTPRMSYVFHHFFLNYQPFGEATLGKAGLVIIPLLVAVAIFGSLIGTVFTGSRITFSAARDGFLPDFMSGLHRSSKTPLPAVILLVCVEY